MHTDRSVNNSAMVVTQVMIIIENTGHITSQRGSVRHCCIDRLLSDGKTRFSTCQPGKNKLYFETKLGKRDHVGRIYKLIEFGTDLLRNGVSIMVVKYYGFVTFFSRFFSFFLFLFFRLFRIV